MDVLPTARFRVGVNARAVRGGGHLSVCPGIVEALRAAGFKIEEKMTLLSMAGDRVKWLV